MKKLLSVLSVLAVLSVLVSTGLFGYAKLETQLNNNLDNKEEEFSNSENSSNDQEEMETQVQNGMENNEQKVNRDNVFDYLFAGLNEMYDGFDKDLITFQEPIQNENGDWIISANNKSGHGSYNFRVSQEGLVQNINNSGEIESEIMVNLE
ncbi:hypothetical protein [Staphylococcus phage LY01]|nr:hypothetical protein [Staphylococcus phage LY01]